jgi:hypothetical protein
MADTPLSERSIAGFIKDPKDFIVPFFGGMIATIVARNVVNGFWRELAVFAGVFVIYLVIVGLLKRALIVPFFGGMIATIVARNAANGYWRELAVFAGVFLIYLVIVGLLKRAWVRRSPN